MSEVALIGEVCEVVNGATPKTATESFWGGDIQWITPAEMGGLASPYLARTKRTLTDEGLSSCSARLLPPQSVILSSRAPIGHLVINTEPMATNQGCKGLVPNNDLDSKFLFYYLQSIRERLNDLGSGTTFLELSASKLRQVPIPLPPLNEQRRIVATLDEALGEIGELKRNRQAKIEAFDDVKASMLTELLYPNPGAAAKEWQTVRLGEAFPTKTGGTPPKSEADNYGDFLPFAKPPELNSAVINSTPDGLSKHGAAGARTAPPGSILVSCIGVLGKVGKVGRLLAFNQQINAILPNNDVAVPDFVFYVAESPSFQRQLHELATGTTVPIVNKSKFNSIQLLLPPLDEQRRIVATLDEAALAVDSGKAAGTEELKLADAMASSLMTELLTAA